MLDDEVKKPWAVCSVKPLDIRRVVMRSPFGYEQEVAKDLEDNIFVAMVGRSTKRFDTIKGIVDYVLSQDKTCSEQEILRHIIKRSPKASKKEYIQTFYDFLCSYTNKISFSSLSQTSPSCTQAPEEERARAQDEHMERRLSQKWPVNISFFD